MNHAVKAFRLSCKLTAVGHEARRYSLPFGEVGQSWIGPRRSTLRDSGGISQATRSVARDLCPTLGNRVEWWISVAWRMWLLSRILLGGVVEDEYVASEPVSDVGAVEVATATEWIGRPRLRGECGSTAFSWV